MSQHTPKQLADWRRYEEVRQRGRFNMYDPNARRLTGLSPSAYSYCMKHYETLRAEAEQQP